jgi:hypothetical protein
MRVWSQEAVQESTTRASTVMAEGQLSRLVTPGPPKYRQYSSRKYMRGSAALGPRKEVSGGRAQCTGRLDGALARAALAAAAAAAARAS